MGHSALIKMKALYFLTPCALPVSVNYVSKETLPSQNKKNNDFLFDNV
jgi:hypothetical protein